VLMGVLVDRDSDPMPQVALRRGGGEILTGESLSNFGMRSMVSMQTTA